MRPLPPIIACRMEDAIRRGLAELRPGATMCPGRLARRLGTTLRELRPTYQAMAAHGALRITQGGEPADLATLKGPFRVSLPAELRLG